MGRGAQLGDSNVTSSDPPTPVKQSGAAFAECLTCGRVASLSAGAQQKLQDRGPSGRLICQQCGGLGKLASLQRPSRLPTNLEGAPTDVRKGPVASGYRAPVSDAEQYEVVSATRNELSRPRTEPGPDAADRDDGRRRSKDWVGSSASFNSTQGAVKPLKHVPLNRTR